MTHYSQPAHRATHAVDCPGPQLCICGIDGPLRSGLQTLPVHTARDVDSPTPSTAYRLTRPMQAEQ